MEGALENSLFLQINSLIHVWKLPVLRDGSVGMLDMELLPKGVDFVRAKTLWEIGLHLAGNPATPYGGNPSLAVPGCDFWNRGIDEIRARLARPHPSA